MHTFIRFWLYLHTQQNKFKRQLPAVLLQGYFLMPYSVRAHLSCKSQPNFEQHDFVALAQIL